MLTASLEYTTHSHTHTDTNVKVLAESRLCSHLAMAVLATVMRTLRRKSVSQMTARIRRSSCLVSPHRAHCKHPPWSKQSLPEFFLFSVTAVGGTTGFPEVAVSRFFSGGGFSNFVRNRSLGQCLALTHTICSSLGRPTKIKMSLHISPPFRRERMLVSSIRKNASPSSQRERSQNAISTVRAE